ncbi:hypothetical protein D9M71_667710 [compost metagenome]
MTEREYEFVEQALDEMVARLEQRRAYVSHDSPLGPERNNALVDLFRETRQLKESISRISVLRFRTLATADVYGSAAHSEHLQPALARWLAHPENNAQVQLAMIPQEGSARELIASIVRGSRNWRADS